MGLERTKVVENELRVDLNPVAESEAEPQISQAEPIEHKKSRKKQTDEEYLAQKRQFFEEGPTINSDNWLLDEEILKRSNNLKKSDRVKLLNACERAYYLKDYIKCLELVKIAEKVFGVELDDDEKLKLKEDFETSGKKVKKSAKIEKHIIELINIKEHAQKKLQT